MTQTYSDLVAKDSKKAFNKASEMYDIYASPAFAEARTYLENPANSLSGAGASELVQTQLSVLRAVSINAAEKTSTGTSIAYEGRLLKDPATGNQVVYRGGSNPDQQASMVILPGQQGGWLMQNGQMIRYQDGDVLLRFTPDANGRMQLQATGQNSNGTPFLVGLSDSDGLPATDAYGTSLAELAPSFDANGDLFALSPIDNLNAKATVLTGNNKGDTILFTVNTELSSAMWNLTFSGMAMGFLPLDFSDLAYTTTQTSAATGIQTVTQVTPEFAGIDVVGQNITSTKYISGLVAERVTSTIRNEGDSRIQINDTDFFNSDGIFTSHSATATVTTTQNGHTLVVQYIENANGDLVADKLLSLDGQPPVDDSAYIASLNQQQVSPWDLAANTPGAAALSVSGSDGSIHPATPAETLAGLDPNRPSGAQTLANFLTSGRLIDSLSLVRAIQSGQPLPIAASGLRLAAGFDPANTQLNITSNAVAGVLSLVGLESALRQGDSVAALASGANALKFGLDAYVGFAAQNVAPFADALEYQAALNSIDGASALAGSLGKALPYINLVNSLSHNDPVGAAMAVLAMNPTTAPIAIAYTVFNLISSIFGGGSSEPEWTPPPEPWGQAHAVWSGTSVATQSIGNEGQSTVDTTFKGFVAYLNRLADEEQAANPSFALGVIANRLPGLDYRAYSGYVLQDVDPLTGEVRNANLHYGLDGSPYDATPGSPEASQSLAERFVRSALARGAIAPMWEVETARLQSALGAPDAGLTEEERAGRAGHLATTPVGNDQVFRPIALDLDGDGIEVTDRTHGVAFDVDDSGFLKNTAWVNADDGLLVLDRNLNGTIDSGKEVFSNGTVDLAAKGLAGLRWVDANYDGRIDALDPVYAQLKVWRDADAAWRIAA